MKKTTIAVHKGTLTDMKTGGMNTPIYTSSATNYFGKKDIIYPRRFNLPNQDAVAKKIASLENAEAGLVFSSGMGAISTSILAHVGNGDHVVLLDSLYGGTHHFATQWFEHFGIKYSFAGTNSESVIDAVKENTKLIVIESPTNPLLAVLDIKKIAGFAKQKNIITIIDNTFATPVNQNPLGLGIDIVIHSGTKYLGGHSDLCCGMVACSKERLKKILNLAISLGPNLDAQSCYLLERSMKTLVLRVKKQSENAMQLAQFLEGHKGILKVYYPGLEHFEGHEIAKSQMTDFGGILSFELKGKDPDKFITGLKVISPAVSLGGVETTICSPAMTSHSPMTASERERIGVTDSLLRISVGIEHIDDLKQDITTTLKSI